MSDRRRAIRERVSTTPVTDPGGPQTLRILDWDYVYDSEVLRRFERRRDVIVQVETVHSSSAVVECLRDRSTVDLAALGNYAVPEAVDRGLLQPFDVDEFEHYDAIFDALKRDYLSENGQVYAVPRSFGQTPLCYHPRRVGRELHSWAPLVRGELSSSCLRDDARLAALYVSLVEDTAPPRESLADPSKRQLRDRFVRLFDGVERLWGTAAESRALFRRLAPVSAGPVWRFVARRLQREGSPIEVVRPAEGTKAWLIGFVRPAGSDRGELAATFVDAWFDWLGWETLMKPLDIPVPAATVFERYDKEPSAYGLDDFDQFVEQPPLSPETVERYETAWEEAKRAASPGRDE